MGLAIVCPGQGSQTAAMFASLRSHTEAASILNLASQHLDVDLGRLQDDDRIHSNRIAQVLLCTYALATWKILSPLLGEHKPDLFLGYSVGEVCAHALAGNIPQRDALALCEKRAVAMDAAVDLPQTMTAVRGLSQDESDEVCISHQVEVAIYNGPQHFLLGGHTDSIESLCTHIKATSSGQVHQLKVTVASHTSLLASATRKFSDVLSGMELKKPTTPVIAGIDASPVRQIEEIRHTLALQLSTPIQWERCLHTAHEMGATCFLELGPGRAMTKMIQETLPYVTARSIADFKSIEGAAMWARKHLDQAP